MLKSGEYMVTDIAGYIKKIMGVAPSHFCPKRRETINPRAFTLTRGLEGFTIMKTTNPEEGNVYEKD
jgi:hypothetical protein